MIARRKVPWGCQALAAALRDGYRSWFGSQRNGPKLSPFGTLVLTHAGFITCAVGALMRDIFLLRIMYVISNVLQTGIFLFSFHRVLYGQAAWYALFIFTNLFQILVLLFDSRSVSLSPLQRPIFHDVFLPQGFTKVQFRKMWSYGNYEVCPLGSSLISRSEELSTLYLIAKGTLRMELDKNVIGHLTEGSFIGEEQFFNPEKTVNATATLLCEEDTELLKWNTKELVDTLSHQPTIRSVFTMTLARANMRKAAETQKTHAMTVKRMQDTLEQANKKVLKIKKRMGSLYRWGG